MSSSVIYYQALANWIRGRHYLSLSLSIDTLMSLADFKPGDIEC